jgi:hypothetical protein
VNTDEAVSRDPAGSGQARMREQGRDVLQVARGVADVWARPARGGEDDRLTQALLGRPAEVLEARGAWVRVRLPDYEGWMERAHLAPPAAEQPAEVLAVTAPAGSA